MSRTVVHGAALLPEGIRSGVTVVIENGVITDVAGGAEEEHGDALIVPGFIDTHVHGGAGADFMDGTGEAIRSIVGFHARHGTTALAATTLSGSPKALALAVRAIAAARAPADGAEIVSVHLEGPFINRASAGAQDVRWIRDPNIHELGELIALAPDLSWIVTLAPECPGALAMIEAFRQSARFSIGHTRATFVESIDAIRHGATHFTHLFNAMTGLHHREPGVVGAAMLSSGTTAELIADGVHVHPGILGLVARLMGGRVSLVTDAIRACGMPDGSYRLYDYEVTVSDGAARLADGTLAGSVLTMDQAVRNMVELAGVPIDAAVRMATEVPARIAGVANRKGRIQIGYDADLLVLSPKLTVERIFVRGKEIDAG